MNNEPRKQSLPDRYFSSPEEAVQSITELLKKHDFKTLASYYDLTGFDVNPADLESGEFFIRTTRPEVAHPAGFWRYKHPFSPGFKYLGTKPASRDNAYIIDLIVKINQGADTPPQVGTDSFYMIKSAKGWQILPGHVQEENAAGSSEPVSAPDPLPDPPWLKK